MRKSSDSDSRGLTVRSSNIRLGEPNAVKKTITTDFRIFAFQHWQPSCSLKQIRSLGCWTALDLKTTFNNLELVFDSYAF